MNLEPAEGQIDPTDRQITRFSIMAKKKNGRLSPFFGPHCHCFGHDALYSRHATDVGARVENEQPKKHDLWMDFSIAC